MAKKAVDYSAMSASELEAAENSAIEAFAAIDRDNITTQSLNEATDITESINAIRAERTVRVGLADQFQELSSAINPPPVEGGDEDDSTAEFAARKAKMKGNEREEEDDEEDIVKNKDEKEKDGPRRKKEDIRVVPKKSRLNASLSEAARYVPAVPDANTSALQSIMTASADIPGFAQGGEIVDMDSLVRAIHVKSRTLPDGSGYVPVATVNREFSFNLSNRSTKQEIDAVLKEALNPQILTAAGGWCAPSTISYDFYNIIAEGGLLDLPTVGITRGGLQFPTSPSFGDVIGDIWTWTETQDIAAVTGTAQSGIKPCFRATCPAYTNVRLSCDGLCLTMGNLMNDAFPELVANQMRLLFAAQAHYTNGRIIASLVAGSTAVVMPSVTGHGLTAPLLEAIELHVEDYRIKFRMEPDAILECVLPTWIRPMMRADLSKRTVADIDFLGVRDEELMGWFDERDIRAQFVQDYQTGAPGQLGQVTPSTAWPLTVDFILYAAGTWLRGNGMRLDLGVIRDSNLNQTNDFTAAWMEECWLTAKVGHESRVVTVPICANGATQAGVTMGCTG